MPSFLHLQLNLRRKQFSNEAEIDLLHLENTLYLRTLMSESTLCNCLNVKELLA